MKIALVHDMLGEFGGAERVLLAMSEIWPKAPIYTAFYRRGPAWERFKGKDIRVSWVHHIPGFATKLHSPLRFLAPLIWNSFSGGAGSRSAGDFSQYDVILSSASWYVTKGFGTRGTTRKGPIEICYCHTPPRWLYGYPTSVEWQKFALVRAYANIVGFFMRQYDFEAAQRVDQFIANSEETKRRIQKFYRRDATVIYPPIDLPKQNETRNSKLETRSRSYFLVISRLVGGKGLQLAIEAARTLGFPLKIAGAPAGYATEYAELVRDAPANVEFLGYVSDEVLHDLYAKAKAFLALATDEDFGMTPVEAMAHGTPVIAYAGGGYLESVAEGKTGMFFHEPTEKSLVATIEKFLRIKKDWSKECMAHAKAFSKERFQKELKALVKQYE
jgi:glycosyltransferase involved in cell wall biosynthesis